MAASPVVAQSGDSLNDNAKEQTRSEAKSERPKRTDNDREPLGTVERLDIKFKFTREGGSDYKTSISFRGDMTLNSDVNLRLGLPIERDRDESGQITWGLGDAETRPLWRIGHKSSVTYRAGCGLKIPTASPSSFGDGKWTLTPTFAVGKYYERKNISVSLLLSNEFSFAGDPSRKSINNLSLQPSLLVNVTPDVWASVETNAKYNWIKKSWSLPFSLETGVQLGRWYGLTLEGSVPIVGESDKKYDIQCTVRRYLR